MNRIDRIESIRLEGMLPKVFENESIPNSEVWRSDVVFRRGERWLVEAASGGGKSSLCAYMFGSRTDYLGRLYLNDVDVSGIPVAEWQRLRRCHIAYLPQELALFPELTALENIRLKASLAGDVQEERIAGWLKELGIDSRADYPVGRMSIGQQQRVAIIRSICQPFDFIVLDEPVSHLDEENNRIAARMVMREADRQGAGIITTSVGNRLLLDSLKTIKL